MVQLALTNCRDGSLEDMINWILTYSGDPSLSMIEQQQQQPVMSSHQESLKLVLVVRGDLQMSAGKMAAQCVHAALAVNRIVELDYPLSYYNWRNNGEATICLRCSSEDELNELEARARASGSTLSLFEIML